MSGRMSLGLFSDMKWRIFYALMFISLRSLLIVAIFGMVLVVYLCPSK